MRSYALQASTVPFLAFPLCVSSYVFLQFSGNSRVQHRPGGLMETPSGETKPKKRRSYCQASFLCFFPCGLPSQEVGRTTEVAVSGSQETPKGKVLTSVFAQAGVQVPRPSGLAERQTTHSSASGTDECKRTVHECARDSPSLEYRG